MAGHRAYRSHESERRGELSGSLGMGNPNVSWNEPGADGQPLFRDDAIRRGLTSFNGEALPAAGATAAVNHHTQPPSGTGHRRIAAAQHMTFGGP